MRILNEITIQENIIRNRKPTAQVKILAQELLSDNQVHSRQDILQYVVERGRELELPSFSSGVLNGGFQQAVSDEKCERLDTGTYRMIDENEEHYSYELSIYQQAANVCDNSIVKFQNLARNIDYITATDDEVEYLENLRECIDELKNMKCKFEKQQ